jgi:hypothetical protein
VLKNLLRALNGAGPLPNQVRLYDCSSTVSSWFRYLWELSLIPLRGPNVAQVTEHGAALVNENGVLKVAVARPGTEASFSVEPSEMNRDDFVGYYHTHPYEDGKIGVAFSAGDFVVTINNSQMKLLIVQSGNSIFMLVKTPETLRAVALHSVHRLFRSRYHTYLGQGMTQQTAVLLANLDLCRQYRLAFYMGTIDQVSLQRVL